ncbi:hypothetical protein PIB30_049982 [Stylosanthes scabra]|uniref:Uncharacterized protein n=1 Tax=Stylosanthes scabra TaxID=79078 RepID=A0ABU6RI35_9FABA|nr:hypothetical protein [Stylosanthes scabra]
MSREPLDRTEDPSTCGINLARLTWSRPKDFSNREALNYFLNLFMSIDSEESEQYLTHPVIAKTNPLAFVNSLIHFDPTEQATADDFWSKILTAQRLPVGLPGESTVALKKKVVSYSPQFVAHQFGLAQALPAPISMSIGEQLVHYEVLDVQELEQILDQNQIRKLDRLRAN